MNSSDNGKILLTSFLEKRSKILHIWRNRFCVLTEKYLFTYKGTEKNSESTESINLSECTGVNNSDQYLRKTNTFGLIHRDRIYYFMCKNRNAQEEWIETIEQIIENNNENNNENKMDNNDDDNNNNIKNDI